MKVMKVGYTNRQNQFIQTGTTPRDTKKTEAHQAYELTRKMKRDKGIPTVITSSGTKYRPIG